MGQHLSVMELVKTEMSKMTQDQADLAPCLRWAGSKRRFIDRILALAPHSFETYYEPMLGSASVFLGLSPGQAVLADSNAELVNFYSVLKAKPDDLISRLAKMSASEADYYRIRRAEPVDQLDKAVRFIYLNRLCWNGLYRVNSEGEFNVPFGKRTPEVLWDFENMRMIAERLGSARLLCGDFAASLQDANGADFVFLDPPYPRGSSNGLGFDRYTSTGFSVNDHQRLALFAEELDRRGALVMVCETGDPKILDLFPSHFRSHTYSSKSLIAASSDARRDIEEAILTNYSGE